MTNEYDPVREHMQAFDSANADTIPAPPVPSSPPNAERDQLERKNRLLREKVAELDERIAWLQQENRRLSSMAYKAMNQLRGALGYPQD